MSVPAAEEPIHESCEGCGKLLDVTSFSPFDAVICPHCSAETNVKRIFGNYRLEQRFAIGGMSVIFIGWDTTLDRKVAIKVLNEEYCNDEVRIQAFENEARLTAQVSHPNVVKVFAVGRAYGRFYLVMELLEGRSFERVMKKRGALPEDEVLEIATQVASGLQAAKRAGMIHRDVKPGNIHIDPEGRASLLDFGLALITQDGRAQAEEVWATPYYVPPEALERGIEDFRSDIYAFGATLYHALAGRPPFETTTNSNSILRKAKQTIPRLCKVAPWISPNTGEAIDRMMAFKPEHRWSSYGQVKKALEHAKLTVGQKPATPVHSQTRMKRRKKNGNFGIVFMILLISMSAGLVVWQPWKKNTPKPETPPATAGTQNTQKEAFNPSGKDRPSLQKRWVEARQFTRSGDYEKATGSFLSISSDPTVSGMEQVWTTLEASVAKALAGKPGDARRLIKKSIADLDALPKQRSQQRRYRELCQVLERIPPPAPEDFPEKPKDIIDWMGTFALALKLWDQGLWEEALPPFAKVRGANLPDEFSWFKTYQNIADIYLADGQLLTRLKKFPIPENEQEASDQIGEIADATKKLRTLGRAKYSLRARQAHLARLRKGFKTGPVVTETITWKETESRLRKQGASCRFDAMAILLDSPPKDAPSEAVWAWTYLQKNAAGFLNDLATQSDWTAEKKDGDEITPISGDTMGLKLENGTVVRWSELKPEQLLDNHANDEAHAVAFAWLVGLNDQAEELAENLAQRDEEFKTNWRKVIVGTSQ
ncbi:serine/threonine protein kinase [Akkermansiaceae bacterium]|nr:serine/threonine protein kinase [Akkermansiaceae bacterium]